jgi:DNA-binding beta-propeller fold protein YncE
MKTKITEATFRSALERAGQLFSRIACLGAVILICSSASAQNLFVSGVDANGGEIFKFTWDGGESIFASGLYRPADLTFDTAGNLFVMDYEILNSVGDAAIFKITPNGTLTIFASRVSYLSSLAANQTGILFVADYDSGNIYKYKPDGSRTIFASGLYHPAGMAFDSTGNLFVVDNSAGNVYEGSIYEYKSDGSRVTLAVLNPTDRPAGSGLRQHGQPVHGGFGR